MKSGRGRFAVTRSGRDRYRGHPRHPLSNDVVSSTWVCTMYVRRHVATPRTWPIAHETVHAREAIRSCGKHVESCTRPADVTDNGPTIVSVGTKTSDPLPTSPSLSLYRGKKRKALPCTWLELLPQDVPVERLGRRRKNTRCVTEPGTREISLSANRDVGRETLRFSRPLVSLVSGTRGHRSFENDLERTRSVPLGLLSRFRQRRFSTRF